MAIKTSCTSLKSLNVCFSFLSSAKVDLQLPQLEGSSASAPAELPPEPKPKFMERIITSLGEEGGPTTFRKSKTQNGKVRSLRQRDDDDWRKQEWDFYTARNFLMHHGDVNVFFPSYLVYYQCDQFLHGVRSDRHRNKDLSRRQALYFFHMWIFKLYNFWGKKNQGIPVETSLYLFECFIFKKPYGQKLLNMCSYLYFTHTGSS